MAGIEVDRMRQERARPEEAEAIGRLDRVTPVAILHDEELMLLGVGGDVCGGIGEVLRCDGPEFGHREGGKGECYLGASVVRAVPAAPNHVDDGHLIVEVARDHLFGSRVGRRLREGRGTRPDHHDVPEADRGGTFDVRVRVGGVVTPNRVAGASEHREAGRRAGEDALERGQSRIRPPELGRRRVQVDLAAGFEP